MVFGIIWNLQDTVRYYEIIIPFEFVLCQIAPYRNVTYAICTHKDLPDFNKFEL